MDLCPPSLLPIAHGDPGSSELATNALFFPFRLTSPIGCIGGKYSVSKPIRAIRGSNLSTSLKVPWRPGSDEVDRGNNSYQVLKSAFLRSATIEKVCGYTVAKDFEFLSTTFSSFLLSAKCISTPLLAESWSALPHS